MESPQSNNYVPLENSIPHASLESILCTEELHRRPSRSPDHEKENRALVALVSALADSPRTILQTLAETIIDITQCDSAGLSLLTRDGRTPDVSGTRFYWPAIAGMWHPHVGGGTPRNFGPCGDVLDQNRTLLFRHFERRYPYLLPVIPAAEECLLVPFHVHGEAVGTIWAIMHSDRRKFDAEDDRIMASLGKFASSAYQALVRIDNLKTQVAEREKVEAELRGVTDGLEGQVQARTAELQRSEGRLRLAQQVASIGTFERDIRTHTTFAAGLESLYGLAPGRLDGKTIAVASFKDLIHPEDWEGFQHLTQKSLKTGQPTDGEWRAIWPDGSVHWIAARWQVLMDDSGEPSRIVGVNMDVTERKRSEDKLHEYERAVEGLDEMIVVVDREYRYLIANRKFMDLRNMTREQVEGHFANEVMNKGVFEAVVKEKLDECFQGNVVRFEMKYTYPELGERDISVAYFPIIGKTGIDRAACIFQDITDRNRLESVLRGMSRKLIEAQEQERARIARELHDDLNQKLAMLAVELEQLQEDPSDVGSRVQELRKQTTEISNGVQALSHDLHSSQLEYLGVVAGMRSWCKEFGERQKLEIDFRSDVSSVLPHEVGLSLFRVLQEGLHNAVKHSGVRRFEVQLREDSGQIHLVIRDLGKGFDVQEALQGKGLGLTSMRERIRLVDGTISIESHPMSGTTINAHIPLESQELPRRAAG